MRYDETLVRHVEGVLRDPRGPNLGRRLGTEGLGGWFWSGSGTVIRSTGTGHASGAVPQGWTYPHGPRSPGPDGGGPRGSWGWWSWGRLVAGPQRIQRSPTALYLFDRTDLRRSRSARPSVLAPGVPCGWPGSTASPTTCAAGKPPGRWRPQRRGGEGLVLTDPASPYDPSNRRHPGRRKLKRRAAVAGAVVARRGPHHVDVRVDRPGRRPALIRGVARCGASNVGSRVHVAYGPWVAGRWPEARCLP